MPSQKKKKARQTEKIVDKSGDIKITMVERLEHLMEYMGVFVLKGSHVSLSLVS